MKNAKKFFIDVLILSLIAAVVLTIIGYIYDAIVGMSLVWGAIFGLLLTVALLMLSMKFSPGKEDIAESLPTLIIVLAIIGTVKIFWTTMPFDFMVDWSLVGVCLALSAVWFANGLKVKLMNKF
jgi:hypothetical protein